MESKVPSQAKARLIVVAVFVIGFVAGALSINLFQKVTGYGMTQSESPQDRHFKELKQRLNMTKDQEEKIRAIVDHTYTEYKAIGQEVEPKINDARQACRDRVRAVLTPEQLPKFEEFVHERDRERAMKSDQPH
ncbi:MAG TPA: hypothetical protein VLZ81_03445 [Blastocatellia bacterium]|nr:hypothetical protein [Blastocatellia bacterium]